MAVGEVAVREVARDGVEDARPDRGVAHAEVVAVEDVVGRDVIQSARGGSRHRRSARGRRRNRRPAGGPHGGTRLTSMSLPGSFAFLTTGCLLYASIAGPVAAQTKSGPRIPASQ